MPMEIPGDTGEESASSARADQILRLYSTR